MYNPLNRLKDLLWAVALAGLVAGILRFGLGLGAASGLNDVTPWGLWIAFKLCFVALAGGGFTLAAMVYIFRLEAFRPILRRAILLALLGYGSFIVSLLFDLGLPWHIYMPVISWQHHSVMFEIAWCVMLYFSVLVMEFGPVILEHPWFHHRMFRMAQQLLHKATVPLVIAGIVLSTLHQSSLGALFLMMPHRVHSLWYSPWIPPLFFISAITAGLMALVVEGFLAERLFEQHLPFGILTRLGKIGGLVMWLYLGLRLGDLIWRGVLPGALDGSWQSMLFSFEILIGGILPAVLLMIPKIRLSRNGLFTCALLAIVGVLSQRMSLSMITMWRPESAPYVPTTSEIIIAFAIPAAAGLIYLFFVENLPVADKTIPEGFPGQSALPQIDQTSPVIPNLGWQAQFAWRSGIAVIVTALTIAVLPGRSASEQMIQAVPVQAARGWEMLIIDGDGDGIAVIFPHLEHQARLTEREGNPSAACSVCHHLNLPEDEGTGCWECHQDYYAARSIFNHTLHTSALGGNDSCVECHHGEHRAETAVACIECHETMSPDSGESVFSSLAPGYHDALHEKCLTCHEEQEVSSGKPGLADCSTCHYSLPENSESKQATYHPLSFNFKFKHEGDSDDYSGIMHTLYTGR